jgi:hypothetical protein
VRVSCSKQGDGVANKVQVAAAALAAAALLQAGPVSAKVILEQPQLKKLFQETEQTVAPVKKELTRLPGQVKKNVQQAAKDAPKPRVAEVSTSGGLDPTAIALPLAVVAIAGGAAALNALDEDFGSFMDKTSAKNSNNDGVGYEVAIKEGALAGGPGVQRKPMSKGTGTKKVKAAKAKAAPKAGVNPGSVFSNIFSSKDD